MIDTLLSSPFFGLTLTAAAWCAGCWAQKKTRDRKSTRQNSSNSERSRMP